MNKSLIAATFATALSAGAMAKDIGTPQQTPDRLCKKISATEMFCVAVKNGKAPLVEIETPNGIILGSPGIKHDSEGNAERCLGLLDRTLSLRAVVCPDSAKESQSDAKHQSALKLEI